MFLSDGNSKYKDSKLKTLTWGIPALKSATGVVTCPGAGECAKFCYAQQGRMRMSNCQKAQEKRLALSQSPDFVDTIVRELQGRKWDRVRVHDTGDFYNAAYLGKWFRIMDAFPDKQFFAYTKMVPLLKKAEGGGGIPGNFHVVYSLGGKWDKDVDLKKDWHSRIFRDEAEAKAAGYRESDNEYPLSMADPDLTREALIYHGTKLYDTCLK